MKVSVNEDKSFTPVTLTITLEKREELKVLKELMTHAYTVSNYLLEGGHINNDERVLMSKIMYEIWCKLASLE